MRRRPTPGAIPRQAPYKRTHPDGRAVWVARYKDLSGHRRYAKPRWNGGRASFVRRADAERAIDEALLELRGSGGEPLEVRTYFEGGWLDRHPRSERTNKTSQIGSATRSRFRSRAVRSAIGCSTSSVAATSTSCSTTC